MRAAINKKNNLKAQNTASSVIFLEFERTLKHSQQTIRKVQASENKRKLTGKKNTLFFEKSHSNFKAQIGNLKSF